MTMELLSEIKVLVACEESQAVTIEFRKLGIEAYSCDIQPCSGGYPEFHFQKDVFEVIESQKWDLMIGHPPCTYLSYVGAPWFDIEKHRQKAIERMKKRDLAIEFFLKMWDADIKHICLENPRGYISEKLKYNQIIQPYYFGDSCSKTTCLWLKNLPPLYHNKTVNLFDSEITHVEKGEMTKSGSELLFGTHTLSLSNSERSKLRSKTFPGIAKQMALQWSNYLLNL